MNDFVLGLLAGVGCTTAVAVLLTAVIAARPSGIALRLMGNPDDFDDVEVSVVKGTVMVRPTPKPKSAAPTAPPPIVPGTRRPDPPPNL